MHTPRNHAEGDQSHSCLPEPRTHKHLFFLLNPTAFSGDPRAVPVHLRATALQGGCSGSASRQAAGHGRARVVQDVLQRRCLRARHWGMDGRRPEQSGSKCVLHSHTEYRPHQRLYQPWVAAPRSGAPGARMARERTSCATRRSDSSFQRPPISHASTHSRCGPRRGSSG